jgi:hypothetical protein
MVYTIEYLILSALVTRSKGDLVRIIAICFKSMCTISLYLKESVLDGNMEELRLE